MTDIINLTLSHARILSHEDSTVWAELLVTAPESDVTRSPVDIALVIDCSGSMGRGPGSPLDYACRAARYVLEQLGDDDRATVVGYGDNARVIHPLSSDHAAGITAIGSLGWLGFTNISAGIETAAEQLTVGESEHGRVFLLSDGNANRGVKDAAGIADVAARLKDRYGVSFSTFGVGTQFNEELMERLAVAGGGGYYFIEEPSAVPAVFAEELAEVLAVSIRDARLSWIPTSGVTVGERLGADSNAGDAYLGSLPAGAQRRILLELGVDGVGRDRSLIDVAFSAQTPDGVSVEHALSGLIEVHPDESVVADGVVPEILARVVELQAAKTQAEAAEAAKRGQLDQARRLVDRARRSVQTYAADNEWASGVLMNQLSSLDASSADLRNYSDASAKRIRSRSYLARNNKG